ncbi:MAG TPA: nitroreductase/quinone reductase family protein [Ktedonobacteraceae bacterium]|nr:nitroreductase/quinone reductase family protein [Ktedonobacteraceae bacterium]
MAVETTAQVRQGPPKFVNALIGLLLRSPFSGGIGNVLMLLEFRGRKSGKLYRLPVGYIRQGETVTTFTDRNWWKNLRDQVSVMLYLKGKKLRGTAAIVQEPNLVAEGLSTFVQQHPRAARPYGISFDAAGQLDTESVRQSARRFTMICIRLQ